MSRKRWKPEQIVSLLRKIEVEIASGKTTPQACRALTGHGRSSGVVAPF